MKIFLVLLVMLNLASCKSTNDLLKSVVSSNTEFKPVDPFEYGYNIPVIENGTQEFKEMFLCTKDEKLNFLINENVLVSILELTANGEINLGTAAVSSKNKYYRIVMDYSKHRTVSPNPSGSGRIGVGLRLVAKVKTNKADVNLGDLFAIGVASEAEHVEGTLTIEVIGIKSKDVTNIIPFPSEINPTTIQNAMQALATIKSKIYDENTEIFPQVIAVKPSDNTPETYKDLIEKLGYLYLGT